MANGEGLLKGVLMCLPVTLLKSDYDTVILLTVLRDFLDNLCCETPVSCFKEKY